MWLVQYAGMRSDNTDEVMSILTEKGIPFIPVGIRPFTAEIMGIEDADLTGPVMAYGSCKLVKLVSELGLRPGVFFDYSKFNVMAWSHFLPNEMVNGDPAFGTIREFRNLGDAGVEHDVFVRPVMDLKLFSGSVKPKGDTFAKLLDEKLNGMEGYENTLLAISSVAELHGEWRCFIVNRKFVTGSQYRINGELKPDAKLPPGLEDYVNKVAAKWLPHDHCTMDVALVTNNDIVRSQSFKVMEFNCINASGLYKADAEKLVDALNSLMV